MDEQGTFERRFYLEHFRGRSIVLSAIEYDADEPVQRVAATLAAVGAHVLLVLGRVDAMSHIELGARRAAHAWLRMRQQNPAVVEVGDHPHEVAVDLAAHLRPFKLVLVDGREAGLDDPPASFVTVDPVAEELPEGPHATLATRALAVGVRSVNVCRPDVLEDELLTYRGAGVLYTPQQYCTVGPLRLDDFPAAERLTSWGVAEGFLKPRPPEELATLLLAGYGARFGDEHLAGVAALLTAPYAEDRVGEVAALTTISRFAGGGVGGMIVRRMLADGWAAGLSAVFACTTSTAAARFFAGLGFQEVPHAAIPEAKWEGYDPARRRRVIALRHRLGDGS